MGHKNHKGKDLVIFEYEEEKEGCLPALFIGIIVLNELFNLVASVIA